MHKKIILKILPIIILLITISLTIGFSAFQNELLIKDLWAIVRVKKDIRITNIILNNTTNNATSNWEEYNINEIEASINLPENNSTITYAITITNIGNAEMGILDITGLPNNLNYSVSNYTLKNKLCDDNNHNLCSLGSISTILVTISYNENSYNPNNTNYKINLNFHFKRCYNITYHGFNNTEELPNNILEEETKNITFNNNTSIPISVLVNGAIGNYNNPNLTISNATSNIDIYKKYQINYILNEGTQAPNQIIFIAPNETVTILPPTREEYNFAGWYNNPEFEGESITTLSNINKDITLYANWTQYDYFIKNKVFDGTENNIINTGIYLYSIENVNKNFRIKFTIDSYDSSYETSSNINSNQPPTILSSMLETNSPYSGFVYRLVPNAGSTKYSIKINDSHVTSFLGYYQLNNNTNVEIIRENNIIYTKINSNIYTKVLEYKNTIDTFDIPLTIGGNINANGEYDRLFKGELSNISIEFYEGSIIPNTYSYREIKTENSYDLIGTIEFNGTNYIDTGINLFSATNINKDFDISLTIDKLGGNTSQATLINLKDESQNNVWPGVAYRLKSNNNFEFTARWPGKTNASAEDRTTPPKQISISRRNGIIYYSINNDTPSKLIETPPSSLTTPFNQNLTFGSSLNSSGTPFRFFNGIISNISVRLFDN